MSYTKYHYQYEKESRIKFSAGLTAEKESRTAPVN